MASIQHSGQLLNHMAWYPPEWTTSLYGLWNFSADCQIHNDSVCWWFLYNSYHYKQETHFASPKEPQWQILCVLSLLLCCWHRSLNMETFRVLSWSSLVFSTSHSFQNKTVYLLLWLLCLWKRKFMLGAYSASWISLYNFELPPPCVASDTPLICDYRLAFVP